MAIRWKVRQYARWMQLARDEPFRRPASELARSVLLEFLSCFLTETELRELGMAEFITRAPNLLGMATLSVSKARRLDQELARESEAMSRIGQAKPAKLRKAR